MSTTEVPWKSLRAWVCFAAVAVVGLSLDLWTKYYAFRVLPPIDVAALAGPKPPEEHFIPHLLDFVLMTNEGAVFGLGQGKRSVFLVVSLAAIGFLGFLFVRSEARRWYQVTLGLLLAGVLGNMYDRLFHGHVRDMIYLFPGVPNPLREFFPRWDTLFPWIFNLADVFLCTGVAVMLVWSLLSPNPDRPKSAADPKDPAGLKPGP